MEIINKKLEEIKPYENNPRFNDNAVDMVANSIKEFGFKVPIIIDKNNTIIAGHTRYKASIKLGLKEVPCVVANDLTEEQVKAFRIADNKVGEIAEWDFDKLEKELAELNDFNMEDFDFESCEEDEDDAKIVEDQVPEVDEKNEPISKVGDIYQLGNHRLMCGDSTKEQDVNKLMNGGIADMVFTDPPYNANYSSRVDINRRKPWGGILNDNMGHEQFEDFLLDLNSTIYDFTKDGSSIYECIDWKHYSQLEKIFKNVFNMKSMIVWNKNYFGLGTYYRTKHELILFGVKGNKMNVWEGGHNEMDVWDIDREKVNNYEHPTQKPVTISARAIKNSSNEGNIVLDLFGGSGSTLIASEQLNRKCYMMELDPKYVDVIISRWEYFTGKKAIKIN